MGALGVSDLKPTFTVLGLQSGCRGVSISFGGNLRVPGSHKHIKKKKVRFLFLLYYHDHRNLAFIAISILASFEIEKKILTEEKMFRNQTKGTVCSILVLPLYGGVLCV